MPVVNIPANQARRGDALTINGHTETIENVHVGSTVTTLTTAWEQFRHPNDQTITITRTPTIGETLADIARTTRPRR